MCPVRDRQASETGGALHSLRWSQERATLFEGTGPLSRLQALSSRVLVSI